MTNKKDISTALQRVEPSIPAKGEERYISPYVDVYETAKEYVLLSDMPGVAKTGLKITIHNDELVIDGEVEKPDFENSQVFYSEIQHANYHRAFRLADNIDRDKIEAKLNQGVLKVILPKREDFRTREIQVKFENE